MCAVKNATHSLTSPAV